MEETIFSSEQNMSREEIAESMRSIAEGVIQGKVGLESGDSSIEVTPGENCEFEVKVEREDDGETSLEIELEWNDEKGNDKIKIN